jgi:thioredoxin reductase (NADPH)
MTPDITVYGTDHCEDTRRTREHLNRRGIQYTYVNLDKDLDAERKVVEWNRGRKLTPTLVITGHGSTQRIAEPDNDELDALLAEYGVAPAA